MPDTKSLCRTAFLALVASTALLASTDARAGGCKPNGQVCATSMSCCSRNCAKPIMKKATALFGLCCAPGARVFNGACCTPATSCPAGTCGTISDGCGGMLNCGGCDATQCLTCVSNACVSACTTGEVCDQGMCVTTTTTTTTTSTSSTTTTTMRGCDLVSANNVELSPIDDETGTSVSGNFITQSGAFDPDGDTLQVSSVAFDAATSSAGLTATTSEAVTGHEIISVYTGFIQDAAHLAGTLDVVLSTGAYTYTNGAGAEGLPVGNTTVEFTFAVNDGINPDCGANADLDVVVVGDDESTETTTTTTETTTTTAPTCANGGIACGQPCGGACGGICLTSGAGCLGEHLCGPTAGACISGGQSGTGCANDSACPTGEVCLGNACGAVPNSGCAQVCPE